MALFGGSSKNEKAKVKSVDTKESVEKKESEVKSKPSSNAIIATIITPGTEITGDIKSNDTVHLDGTLHGNVVAKNMVVVGKSGVIHGNVKAEKVVVNGTIKGNIMCSDLEIMKSGSIYQKVDADRMIVDGSIEGEVVSRTSINVLKDGKMKVSLVKTKRARVNGSIEGKIVTTELLEVGTNGVVQGEIVVKNIRTEEGGKMIGSMATYEEPTRGSAPKETPLKRETVKKSPETQAKSTTPKTQG
ncbi:MAG TPA: polymer-forming cytoskeletal protein [Epsilonproteobacteria bacterium]|nr:polymer-forming cytoskeletal protein [Campylobacterota bacterium]